MSYAADYLPGIHLESEFLSLLMARDQSDPVSIISPTVSTAADKSAEKVFTKILATGQPPMFLLHYACVSSDATVVESIINFVSPHFNGDDVISLISESAQNLERISHTLFIQAKKSMDELGLKPDPSFPVE